jgi:hypothetical protein
MLRIRDVPASSHLRSLAKFADGIRADLVVNAAGDFHLTSPRRAFEHDDPDACAAQNPQRNILKREEGASKALHSESQVRSLSTPIDMLNDSTAGSKSPRWPESAPMNHE